MVLPVKFEACISTAKPTIFPGLLIFIPARQVNWKMIFLPLYFSGAFARFGIYSGIKHHTAYKGTDLI